MVSIINKRWLSCGWHVPDEADSEVMALAFIEEFDAAEVPYQSYGELYKRFLERRRTAKARDLKPPEFSAEALVDCWTELKADIREREIKAGRTLPAVAESQCLRCDGTGLERIFDDEGKELGRRPGCQHDAIEQGERHNEGYAMVDAVLKRAAKDDTAVYICRRIRSDLAREFLAAEDDHEGQKIWRASQTWYHAEKYVIEHDGE